MQALDIIKLSKVNITTLHWFKCNR